jgi:hypothetical protein
MPFTQSRMRLLPVLAMLLACQRLRKRGHAPAACR